jgi:predicted glutamine amidotransferase
VDRFIKQRSRGTQGFGYYIPELNRLTHNPIENKLINNLLAQNASEVLFHHRFPTSTENVQSACHPFSTKWAKFKHNYVMVHNGYLSNEDELKEAHYALGIRYVSMQPDGRFNDSEALMYDLALYLEGHQDEIKAQGAIAFVMIERNEEGKQINLHYGRNTSPLKFQFKNNKYMTLASEGDGVDVKPQVWNTFEYASGKFTSTEVDIPSFVYKTTPYTYDPNDYGQYTPINSYTVYKNVNGVYAHWKCYTDMTTPDVLCHVAPEECPMFAKPSKTDRINRMVQNAQRNADYDTELALDIATQEVTLLEADLAVARAGASAVEDDGTDANSYLQWWEEIEFLEDQIADGEAVLMALMAHAEYEATFASALGDDDDDDEAQTKLLTAVANKLVNK